TIDTIKHGDNFFNLLPQSQTNLNSLVFKLSRMAIFTLVFIFLALVFVYNVISTIVRKYLRGTLTAMDDIPALGGTRHERPGTQSLPYAAPELVVQQIIDSVAHNIGKVDTPLCMACRRAVESVPHFLLVFPKYKEQRQELQGKLRRGATAVRALLGRPKAMKPLFNFIHETQRLQQVYGNQRRRETGRCRT
ncbi:hypothetical protein JB92DRAFT_3193527, partial [Gautieria morchelliformis]